MQFSTPIASQLVKASERQLGYWAKSGLLRPSGKATGHRRYTFQDLVALKAIKALRDQGLSLQKIRRAVIYLQKHFPSVDDASLALLMLITDGRDAYILSDADELREVISGQTVMSTVAIGKLIQETQDQTRQMPVEKDLSVKVNGDSYHLRLTFDPDSQGYTVQCKELPGAIEQGHSENEAKKNGIAAIASVLEFQAKRRSMRGRRATA